MGVVQHPQPDSLPASGRLVSLLVAREEWLGGISRGSLYNLIKAGAIPTVRVGRRRMIDTRDLEPFIQENREASNRQSLEMREAGYPASEPLADENVDGHGTSAG